MILRCTATFLRSYDALPDMAQQAVRAALQGFAETPLIPSQHARRIDASPGVWALPYFLDAAQRAAAEKHSHISALDHASGWITYQIDSESHPDAVVCALRHVGGV